MIWLAPIPTLFPYTTLFRSSARNLLVESFRSIVEKDPDGIALVVPDLGYANAARQDRKSTRLNSSHLGISYAVFCLKKKTETWNNFCKDGKADGIVSNVSRK